MFICPIQTYTQILNVVTTYNLRLCTNGQSHHDRFGTMLSECSNYVLSFGIVT